MGATKEYMREWRKNHPLTEEQKEERRIHRREYHQRSEVRERRKAYRKEYGQRPEVKEKVRVRNKEYNQRPEVKARLNEYQKIRYHTNPVAREKMKAYVADYCKRKIRDPQMVIKDARRQYEQLCEKDPKEAESILKEMESEEGQDFRELMLDGIPEKKGIIKRDEGV